MLTVSIDPGKDTGIAVFSYEGKLQFAGVIRGDYVHLRDFFLDTSGKIHPAWVGIEFVVEMPQIYRASRSKGDPNDLLGLAVQCGHCEAIAHEMRGTVVRYRPREWKGQTPKEIHHPRLRQQLQPDEMKLALLNTYPPGQEHNKWDAIGLGLHHKRKNRRAWQSTIIR